MRDHQNTFGCRGCTRRELLGAIGLATGGAMLDWGGLSLAAETAVGPAPAAGTPVTVRAAFLYPPSEQLRQKGAWWSWPGNDFDAEGRHARYARRLAEIEKRLGVRIVVADQPLASAASTQQWVAEVKETRPDGILLIPFYNGAFAQINQIVKELATKPAQPGVLPSPDIPTIIFSSLGVHHGGLLGYQAAGIYLAQTLDEELKAVEWGMRMIRTARRMGESRLLSIAGSREPREASAPQWGTKVRVVPMKRFVDEIDATPVTAEVRELARSFRRSARKVIEPKEPEILTAAKVHFALKRLLDAEQAQAVTIDCLRRGDYMPCMSFMTLRDQGTAAACENDIPAALTLMLMQHLFERPGFQANPCYDTERNLFFASHCTAPSRLHGAGSRTATHYLRDYAHTNDPTCVPQVFFTPGEPMTMAHYYGSPTPTLFVYTGKVVKSLDVPPAAGCTTNVTLAIDEPKDVREVKGHHNIIVCGDYGRQLRQFAQLYGIEVKA